MRTAPVRAALLKALCRLLGCGDLKVRLGLIFNLLFKTCKVFSRLTDRFLVTPTISFGLLVPKVVTAVVIVLCMRAPDSARRLLLKMAIGWLLSTVL